MKRKHKLIVFYSLLVLISVLLLNYMLKAQEYNEIHLENQKFISFKLDPITKKPIDYDPVKAAAAIAAKSFVFRLKFYSGVFSIIAAFLRIYWFEPKTWKKIKEKLKETGGRS